MRVTHFQDMATDEQMFHRTLEAVIKVVVRHLNQTGTEITRVFSGCALRSPPPVAGLWTLTLTLHDPGAGENRKGKARMMT